MLLTLPFLCLCDQAGPHNCAGVNVIELVAMQLKGKVQEEAYNVSVGFEINLGSEYSRRLSYVA